MYSLKQAGSEHALAKAIMRNYFLEFGGPPTLKAAHTLRSRDTSWMKSASSFENIPGKGMHCQVHIGELPLFLQLRISAFSH
jgi:cation transport ATPase